MRFYIVSNLIVIFKRILIFLLPLIRIKQKIFNNKTLVVLCYHRVREKTDIFYDRNISVTPAQFRKQMLYIKKYFNVVSMDQLIDVYYNGCEFKPNSLMVTFDDGYKDNAINAFPILEKLEIPAVVFLITGLINKDIISWEDRLSYAFNNIQDEMVEVSNNEYYSIKTIEQKNTAVWEICKKLRSIKPDQRDEIIHNLFITYNIDTNKEEELSRRMNISFMTKDEIQYWSNHGIDFGIHTVTHPSLPLLQEEEINTEISDSKKSLKNILNKEVVSFAYPFGKYQDFNDLTRSILVQNKIKIGMTFEPGVNRYDTDSLELYRLGIQGESTFKLFCHGLSGIAFGNKKIIL